MPVAAAQAQEAAMAGTALIPGGGTFDDAEDEEIASLHSAGSPGDSEADFDCWGDAEPAALAFPGIRSGAYRIARDDPSSCERAGPVNFDQAPPSTGGSVVRLAAIRATAVQCSELGAMNKVLTPVRRSVRTPKQAQAAASALPISTMLDEAHYVFAPNEQLEPGWAGRLVTAKGQAKEKEAFVPPQAEAAPMAAPVPTDEVVTGKPASATFDTEPCKPPADQVAPSGSGVGRPRRKREASAPPSEPVRRSQRVRSKQC